MRVVLESDVYYFHDLAYFVRRSIHIKHWYGAGDAPSINPFGADKVPVNETACCSAVQESPNGVDFAGVCCE